MVPAETSHLALEIVFNSKNHSQEFKEMDLKKFITVRHVNASFEIVSRTPNRVVVQIKSADLQNIYDNMFLNQTIEIKTFFLSANGSFGKSALALKLSVNNPRPMLTSSFAKPAGFERIAKTQSFNINSPLIYRNGNSKKMSSN